MPSDSDLDVCVICEGTWPYVSGGVSSVISQQIENMPDLTFGVFYIGDKEAHAQKEKYPLPKNVLGISKVFIFEKFSEKELDPLGISNSQTKTFYRKLRSYLLSDSDSEKLQTLEDLILAFLEVEEALSFGDYCYGYESWNILEEVAEKFFSKESFLDYFYTTRFMMVPLWLLAKSIKHIPKAKVYYSPCNGYAGFMAVLAARLHGGRSVISEHGIYIKERIVEIIDANWIHDYHSLYGDVDANIGAIKQMWINKFMLMSKWVYQYCDTLTTLYVGNLNLQEEFGAPQGKSVIIPNGIKLEPFEMAYQKRKARLASETPCTIGFVGRVVSIKDVKTLISAFSILKDLIEPVNLMIIGPTEEDPIYFVECQTLAKTLQLDSSISFCGKQDLKLMLDKVDVMVLTSISEGQPLSVLEAFAVGIPCVVTDVGSCRSLIFGDSWEDKALGSAGKLTKVGMPQETAYALHELISNKDKLLKMGEIGRERVKRFYLQENIIQAYREILKPSTSFPEKA